MKIICISNQKGGILKSTTALSLGILLSRAGRRVLLIDFNAQASISETFLDFQDCSDRAIYRVLRDTKGIRECVVALTPTLSLIPNDLDFQYYPGELDKRTFVDQYVLADKLDDISDEFDFVILDCPPEQPVQNVIALSASDIVIIPTDPSRWAMQGTLKIIDSITEIQSKKRSRTHIERVIILPSAIHRTPRRFFSDREFTEFHAKLRETLGNELIMVSDIIIPHDEKAYMLQGLSREELGTADLGILRVYQQFIDKAGI